MIAKTLVKPLAHKFFAKSKFAAKILVLEMKVEIGEISMKDIYNLIGLYSEAIDYFTSKSDESFIYFKLQLQKLLKKERVSTMITELEVLKKKLGLRTSKKLLEKVISKKPDMDMQAKKNNFKNYKTEALKVKKENEQKQLVTKHASIVSMNDDKVKNDLVKQKENFKERLAQRRENSKSRRGRSMSSNKTLKGEKMKRNCSNVSLGLGRVDDNDIFRTDTILDEYGAGINDCTKTQQRGRGM